MTNKLNVNGKQNMVSNESNLNAGGSINSKNKNISFGRAMMIAINRSKNFNIESGVDNLPYNDVLELGLIGIYYADK